MNYRSISDMNDTILAGLHRLPKDIDLVVGVPRSGIIAATLIALLHNAKLTDLDSYVSGRIFSSGQTKVAGIRQAKGPRRKVLIVDDSINGGTAMDIARQRVADSGIDDDVVFSAIYGSKAVHPQADIVFETVPWPRMFQWNFMHHKFLVDCCIDIDGVLCHDPSREENDDGPAYVGFLQNAHPLYAFSVPLGHLVTSRLEKYRPQTESWLDAQGIVYQKLTMLDLPSAAERRKRGVHGQFKAGIYRDSNARLFIESENGQARKIARLSGKPVLCLQTHQIINSAGSDHVGRPLLKRAVRRLLGPAAFENLRTRIRRS